MHDKLVWHNHLTQIPSFANLCNHQHWQSRDSGSGCAVFATFFIRFEANLSEYGSYSLHIRMFRYIRKHHLFASFASYSLQNTCTNSHTNILFNAKQMYFLILANVSFKIFGLKQIFANIKRISHSSEYSLANICVHANYRFVLFQMIKESLSQS